LYVLVYSSKGLVLTIRVRTLQEVGRCCDSTDPSLAPHYEEAATELKSKNVKLAKVGALPDNN
jgi:hypothetical protein